MFITDDDFPVVGYPHGRRRISRSSIIMQRADTAFAPSILIVEEDSDNRLMLRLLLETWKYRVIEAGSGEEAFVLAEKEQPDVILMDVRLPLLDGLATTRRIRASTKIDGVPVVLLSGYAEDEYRRAAFAAGGSEYLVKPLDFAKLENTLGKYVFA